MACPRVSYRRRMHYATRGNRMKMVRTPGNRIVMQKRGKRSQGPHTPWVLGHKRLAGTKALGHFDSRHAGHHSKTVSRTYGGVLSHDQVRDRVIRAFLMDEQRIVKKVLAARTTFQKLKKKRDAKRRRKAAQTTSAASAKTAKTKDAKKTKKASKGPVGAKVVKTTGAAAPKTIAKPAAAAPAKRTGAPVGARLAKK